ncbi:glycosyltransferase family 1 protein (plasmid) [Azospirillum argentinense]|uniref:Glycosyltransferase family 1 protein n=1 Tax=Azospirillum argentinense TaxID=2970906 RepID=A0A4D8PYD6_9PROT|nr:glycosyltransferase [Azospirillum argentinense]QCN99589.1 glycosyltransferase family 1 protein [Azospirillum argentinense]
MAVIAYFLPVCNTPSGGVKVILQHVELLRANGINAVAFAPPNFKYFLETSAPIIFMNEGFIKVPSKSFLVFPEVERTAVESVSASDDIYRVVFCQNHYEMSRGALSDAKRFRLHDVFACSDVIAEAICNTFKVRNVPVVPAPVSKIFKPLEKKLRTIAFMPRKMPDLVERLKNLIPESSLWSWIPIDGQCEEDVARILGYASVFLSLSHREGLGLPPLEAMAAGCIIAGFHGGGGRSYATAENGFWHDEGDIIGVAKSLRRSINLSDEKTDPFSQMIDEGRRTADNFSMDKVEKDLLMYWRSRIRIAGRQESDYQIHSGL